MDQSTVKASEGGLPAQLAAGLGPELRDALDSPIRREILRLLDDGDHARNEREIASKLTEFTVSEVSYHARVLERSGGVVVDRARSGSGGQRGLNISDLAKDAQVHAVLRATQGFDRDHRRAAGRHSSRFLTMLRIPHPTISVRLGNRHGDRS
jgi:DNA-binding transcriptional ArsR family regulator